MRAMILAAGLGTRMRPLTEQTPKPLLRAGDHSLIEHRILALREGGFTELVINHAWLGDQIEETLGDGSRYGVTLRYSPETEPLETAGGIRRALPLLESGSSDEPFALVNGDIWTDYDFSRLRHGLPPERKGHLVLVDNPEHHPEGDFALSKQGEVCLKGEQRLTYSGIALFRPSMFSKVPQGIYPLAPVIREACQQKTLTGEYFEGIWMDIGTPERLTELDDFLKRNT